MKKVCLMFNHLRLQDGVGRSAIAIANWLTRKKLAEVTLMPIYINDRKCHQLLESGVIVKPIIGFFFQGLPHIINKIPVSWINKKAKLKDYDVLVGFQYALSIKCIAAMTNHNSSSKFAWMHCYDEGLTLRKEYETIGKVICVSRCNSERLHVEIPSIMTDFSYNPIDETVVQQLGEESVEIDSITDRPLFITVGRMSPEKGFGRLLTVCRRLRNEGYKFKLWLIGDGPIYPQLLQQMKTLGLEDCVSFYGQQSNPYKYISKADIFVCSSFVEGYSTACTEAIMLGVPVISTCVSGAEEIIEEAECGELVEMDDESLYSGMKKVLQTPSIIKEWKDVLKTTRKKFYAETRIQKLINILDLNLIDDE